MPAHAPSSSMSGMSAGCKESFSSRSTYSRNSTAMSVLTGMCAAAVPPPEIPNVYMKL